MLIDQIKIRTLLNFLWGEVDELVEESGRRSLSPIGLLDKITKELYTSGYTREEVNDFYKEVMELGDRVFKFIRGEYSEAISVEEMMEFLYFAKEIGGNGDTWKDISGKLVKAGFQNVNSMSIADFFAIISSNGGEKDTTASHRM